MAVGTDLVVVHVQQAEGLDDPLGRQVVGVADVLLNELQRLVLRTEALNAHTYRLRYPDCIGQLDFALVSVARLHDILGDAVRHVRVTAIYLRGVFAGQRTAADPADAAVGVARQLPAGHTTVGIRAADDKAASRVDQLLEVSVQTVLTGGQYHHGFDDMAEIADLHIRAVLYRAEEGGDAAGIVVKTDLRFGIGAEHLAGVVFRAALDAHADLFLTGDKDFLESSVTDPRIISVPEFLTM